MQNGLLFYISGEKGPYPDVAQGCSVPNFLRSVEKIHDGVGGGAAIRCLPDQLLTYWAPGNLYSQRGTVSFFWRPRTALGETEFPLFRVAFADHSSWDALFMRIDYNGHGIDAFVTDLNLSRIRVSHRFETLPDADSWFHVAFVWDETIGVRLYIDGELAASKDATALLWAGLDQFGTHSRIISNAQVQSSYNYMRTGDFDELCIFDRMLGDAQVKALASLQMPELEPLPCRTLEDETTRLEWMRRFGFDAATLPAPISHPFTHVRKVEIHNAWDMKRWWMKGCDGIRETTWPGVYNRSRLPGRTDYFVLPDWDCYSVSGKEITFEPVADEYFNQIEISGSAHGVLRIHGRMEEQLTVRRESSERSVLRLDEPVRNVSVTFTNDEIEEPIGDITLLQVEAGMAPENTRREGFTFGADDGSRNVKDVRAFIAGRFTPDERTLLLGGSTVPAKQSGGLPLLHLAMPYQADDNWGMDGLVLHLPALHAKPTHGRYVLVTVQIKDPLWIYRDLIHFTFSVLPGKAKTLWLDTRDRILPHGKTLYATLAFSAPVDTLDGLRAEIVYKSAEAAKAEHVADRWIQVKDNYANLVEENPSNEHFNMFNRFKVDIEDLLRIEPSHRLAREYYFDKFKTQAPAFELSPCPQGVPQWAWRQTEYMGYVKRYIRWWIDKRQIENGEFGGGLSDDGDLTSWWPGPALCGCMPGKIRASLLREMEAFYDQGMFANGLCAIQTDQLHTLEEGIQALGQCLTLDPASPKQLERAMENVRGLFFVTGYNAAGHRHMRSGYYSGTRIAEEKAWAYSASDSFHVFHPAYMLVRYNGSPKARKLIVEMADSMMAHFDGERLHVQIDLQTDQDQIHERTREWPLFYAAWQFTGDRRYLDAIADKSLFARPQDLLPNTPQEIEQVICAQYAQLTRKAALREYINTDGQLWVDRGVIDIAAIQRERIGGVGHERFALYPRHFLRWQFAPGKETDVGILVTHAEPSKICLSAFNMTDDAIIARITMEDILPGKWRVRTAVGMQMSCMDGAKTSERELERFSGFDVTFEPGVYTCMELELTAPFTPYWDRTDLAIEPDDVIVRPDCLRIRVHNVGAKESPMTQLVLKNAQGEMIRHSNIPPIPAPVDLYPKIVEIPLWTRGLDLRGCTVEIDPKGELLEITRSNNVVALDEVIA